MSGERISARQAMLQVRGAFPIARLVEGGVGWIVVAGERELSDQPSGYVGSTEQAWRNALAHVIRLHREGRRPASARPSPARRAVREGDMASREFLEDQLVRAVVVAEDQKRPYHERAAARVMMRDCRNRLLALRDRDEETAEEARLWSQPLLPGHIGYVERSAQRPRSPDQSKEVASWQTFGREVSGRRMRNLR